MLVPEGPLAPLALLPVPAALPAWRPWLSAGTHAAAAGHAGTTVTSGSGGSATAGTAGTAGTSLTAKAVVAASALLAVGGGVLVYVAPWPSPSARPATAPTIVPRVRAVRTRCAAAQVGRASRSDFARTVSMTAWTAVTKFWGSSRPTNRGATRAMLGYLSGGSVR